jgi:hypothetical protein
MLAASLDEKFGNHHDAIAEFYYGKLTELEW